mmetsp:Transcript_2826/g.7572  ORF Transcript_2826/g.7572 Transcript_2826/m.7572 type:complete len:267 (+) Transcript_2826:2525-3325(+)
MKPRGSPRLRSRGRRRWEPPSTRRRYPRRPTTRPIPRNTPIAASAATTASLKTARSKTAPSTTPPLRPRRRGPRRRARRFRRLPRRPRRRRSPSRSTNDPSRSDPRRRRRRPPTSAAFPRTRAMRPGKKSPAAYTRRRGVRNREWTRKRPRDAWRTGYVNARSRASSASPRGSRPTRPTTRASARRSTRSRVGSLTTPSAPRGGATPRVPSRIRRGQMNCRIRRMDLQRPWVRLGNGRRPCSRCWPVSTRPRFGAGANGTRRMRGR